MTNVTPTFVFNPTVFPIRSCIRPIDELYSNYGPTVKKQVSFKNEPVLMVSVEEQIKEEILRELRSTPKARRIKHKSTGVSQPLIEENVFRDPSSLWDLSRETPITLNNTQPKERINIEYEKALTHSPKIECFPIFSCLRSSQSKRRGLTVKFAFIQTNILPNGTFFESVAAVEEPNDYWRERERS